MSEYKIYSLSGSILYSFYLKNRTYKEFVENISRYIIQFDDNKFFKIMKYDTTDIIFYSEFIDFFKKNSSSFYYEKMNNALRILGNEFNIVYTETPTLQLNKSELIKNNVNSNFNNVIEQLYWCERFSHKYIRNIIMYSNYCIYGLYEYIDDINDHFYDLQFNYRLFKYTKKIHDIGCNKIYPLKEYAYKISRMYDEVITQLRYNLDDPAYKEFLIYTKVVIRNIENIDNMYTIYSIVKIKTILTDTRENYTDTYLLSENKPLFPLSFEQFMKAHIHYKTPNKKIKLRTYLYRGFRKNIKNKNIRIEKLSLDTILSILSVYSKCYIDLPIEYKKNKDIIMTTLKSNSCMIKHILNNEL